MKLDGIGTFHAKLGVMSDKEPDAFEEGEQKRNAKSIHVTGVSYKTDPQIVREMRRTCVLEKGGESRIRKPKLTLEERIEKAREFLKKEMFMKVPDYVTLTGLSCHLDRTVSHNGHHRAAQTGSKSLVWHHLPRQRKPEILCLAGERVGNYLFCIMQVK